MKISRVRKGTELELNNGWEYEFDKNNKLVSAEKNLPND